MQSSKYNVRNESLASIITLTGIAGIAAITPFIDQFIRSLSGASDNGWVTSLSIFVSAAVGVTLAVVLNLLNRTLHSSQWYRQSLYRIARTEGVWFEGFEPKNPTVGVVTISYSTACRGWIINGGLYLKNSLLEEGRLECISSFTSLNMHFNTDNDAMTYYWKGHEGFWENNKENARGYRGFGEFFFRLGSGGFEEATVFFIRDSVPDPTSHFASCQRISRKPLSADKLLEHLKASASTVDVEDIPKIAAE